MEGLVGHIASYRLVLIALFGWLLLMIKEETGGHIPQAHGPSWWIPGVGR